MDSFLEFHINGLCKYFLFEQNDVLVVIFPPVMVWPPGQSVGLYQFFSRVVLQLVIEAVKEDFPSGLSAVYLLCGLEICEVLVIHQNFDGVWRSL